MELADLEPVLTKVADDLIGLFELHRQMAGVVVHAQMRVEPGIARSIRAQLFEKARRFPARLQVAERLRLEAKMQFLPRTLAQLRGVFDTTPKIASHGPLLFGHGDEFLERTGNRADAAFDAVGQELSQEIEQPVCVFDTFVARPVRRVNLFLDPRAVKSAVGKSVDRENVTV